MAAYMIFIREGEIFNQAEMEEYIKLNRENIGDFKMKLLVAHGNMETMEGESPESIVLLEFPTVEDAKTWYHSPGYQAAAEHRQKGANYRVVMVEGV